MAGDQWSPVAIREVFSMPAALLGRKIGMTRLYDASGKNVLVTIIQAGPCHVSQIKTTATDGYGAVQMAFEDVKPRNSTFPLISHDMKAGLMPKRIHREMRVTENEVSELGLGDALTVDRFDQVQYVDVTGVSKGKGFAGGMKRWGFKGQPASHGTERKHRSPGSVGGRAANLGTGKPKRGIRMAGQLGNVRVTVRSLEVIGRDRKQNLLWVKGAVPGPNRGLLWIRKAVRLSRTKAAKVAKVS